MRRFHLVRYVDESGVSGCGLVAEGVEFSDGTVVVRWRSRAARSTCVWDSVADVLAIHGHGGMTSVSYIDPEKPLLT